MGNPYGPQGGGVSGAIEGMFTANSHPDAGIFDLMSNIIDTNAQKELLRQQLYEKELEAQGRMGDYNPPGPVTEKPGAFMKFFGAEDKAYYPTARQRAAYENGRMNLIDTTDKLRNRYTNEYHLGQQIKRGDLADSEHLIDRPEAQRRMREREDYNKIVRGRKTTLFNEGRSDRSTNRAWAIKDRGFRETEHGLTIDAAKREVEKDIKTATEIELDRKEKQWARPFERIILENRADMSTDQLRSSPGILLHKQFKETVSNLPEMVKARLELIALIRRQSQLKYDPETRESDTLPQILEDLDIAIRQNDKKQYKIRRDLAVAIGHPELVDEDPTLSGVGGNASQAIDQAIPE
jgi:hypothetical protein